MCTAMTLKAPCGDVFFGRTMDFSHELDPEIYCVPRGYKWNNILNSHRINTIYSFMGIGQDLSPIVFSDGINEVGFAAAALYFPGYARYEEIGASNLKMPQIAAIELVKFLLSLSSCVKQARYILNNIQIVGVKDQVTDSIAPLHWIIADKKGNCAVIEKTSDGLHVIDNPMGVLSNSPNLRWHMSNLNNYLNVSPNQHEKSYWGNVELAPFGQGSGTFGLPGDFTSPSRFIRTAYLKSHTDFSQSSEEALISCFHVMESVSIPKGAVVTERSTADYTQYTAFINVSKREYYFKTYNNSGITSVPALKPNAKAEIYSLGKLNRPISFERLNDKARSSQHSG